MKIVRALTLSFVGFVLAACGGDDPQNTNSDARTGDDQPIVGGRKDHGHPAVVAIDIQGDELCTGALIGPHTVLTARHCVGPTSEGVSCPAHGAQVGDLFEASTLTILSGDDVRTATAVATGKKIVVPKSNELCDHDIALIVLDRDVDGIKPLAVNATKAPEVGDEFTAVGFGLRDDQDQDSAGTKVSKAHVVVEGVSDAELVVGQATCNGDSGGPAIDAKSGKIIGVVSRGGPSCEGEDVQNIYTRVDAFASLVTEALK